FQHKGASECRLGSNPPGNAPATTDTFCEFEQLGTNINCARGGAGNTICRPLSYARNGLIKGILYRQQTGNRNPVKIGFVGGTDTHSAWPGKTEEENFDGHMGATENDALERLKGTNPNNRFSNGHTSGGLTGVWAR